MLFVGAGHASFGDDEWQRGDAQVFANIADEVGHVLFVLGVELVVDAVVPALMPAEPGDGVPTIGAGHEFLHLGKRGFRERHRLAVVLADDGRVLCDRGILLLTE